MKTGLRQKLLNITGTLFLAFVLSMPVSYAENTEQVDVFQTNNVQETLTTLPSKNDNSEAKHVFGKFGHTMLLVAGSCLLVLLVLSLYKKLTTSKTLQTREIDIKKDLNSPETIEDATKFFIEKF